MTYYNCATEPFESFCEVSQYIVVSVLKTSLILIQTLSKEQTLTLKKKGLIVSNKTHSSNNFLLSVARCPK